MDRTSSSRTTADGDDEEFVPGPLSSVEDRPLRARVRERLGVSTTGWHVGVSVALALPYVAFLYLFSISHAYELEVTLVALAYSVVAMYLGFKL